MSKYIHKSHNVTILLYHLVCPAKYRKVIFDKKVDQILKQVCLDMSERYEITFIEIGTDDDHVHFLIQSVPTYSPTKIVTLVKSIIAKQVFLRAPYVKRELWGGEFWSDGFFMNTVGQYGNESVIMKYIQKQGIEKEYECLHQQKLVL